MDGRRVDLSQWCASLRVPPWAVVSDFGRVTGSWKQRRNLSASRSLYGVPEHCVKRYCAPSHPSPSPPSPPSPPFVLHPSPGPHCSRSQQLPSLHPPRPKPSEPPPPRQRHRCLTPPRRHSRHGRRCHDQRRHRSERSTVARLPPMAALAQRQPWCTPHAEDSSTHGRIRARTDKKQDGPDERVGGGERGRGGRIEEEGGG